MTEQERNDLQLTITHALKEMEQEAGDRFDIQKINLADLGRRTGISRKRLRNIQKNGFVVKPHALRGTRKEKTVLSGFTGIIDAQLKKGVTNCKLRDRPDGFAKQNGRGAERADTLTL